MVVASSGTKPTVHQPTPDEWKEGPIVDLERPGWVNHTWSPHGYAYSIRFDANGKAEAYKPHFDLWVGPEQAAVSGITVTDRTKPAAKAAAKSKKKKK